MADQIRFEDDSAVLTISHNEEDANSALTIALNTGVIVLDAGQALALAEFCYQHATALYRQAHELDKQE